MIFTEEQISNITESQLQLDKDVVSFTSTLSSMNAQISQFQKADNAANVLYSNFYDIAKQYEGELVNITGANSATYNESDVNASAQQNGIFFPNDNSYQYIVPKQVDNVNGALHATQNSYGYATSLISFPSDPYHGISDLITVIQSAITSSNLTIPVFDTSDLNTITINGGYQSSVSVVAVRATASGTLSYTVGENLVVYDISGNIGIYQVLSFSSVGTILPHGGVNGQIITMSLRSVIPSPSDINGPVFEKSKIAFTSTELESGVSNSSRYQPLLTNNINYIISRVTDLKATYNSRISFIDANKDIRSTPITQLAAEKARIQSNISTLNTWLALSNTGPSGKFHLTTLNALSSTVQSYLTSENSRASQILSALGSVSVSENTFTSSDLTSIYYMRYRWLNTRINRLSGTLTKYYTNQNGATALTTLAQNAQNTQQDFNAFVMTTSVEFRDNSSIMRVGSSANFSIGDTVYAISSSSPSYSVKIAEIINDKTIRLVSPLPPDFFVKSSEKLRLYKLLT